MQQKLPAGRIPTRTNDTAGLIDNNRYPNGTDEHTLEYISLVFVRILIRKGVNMSVMVEEGSEMSNCQL